MKLRDIITANSKSIYDSEDEKFEFTNRLLDCELSAMDLITDSFGEFIIYNKHDDYFLCTKTELIYHASVYNLFDHNLISEKGLLVIYGHEEIVLFFIDGTVKSIHTR